MHAILDLWYGARLVTVYHIMTYPMTSWYHYIVEARGEGGIAIIWYNMIQAKLISRDSTQIKPCRYQHDYDNQHQHQHHHLHQQQDQHTLHYCVIVCAVCGPDRMPCVVLWRPEALDCRVLVPPEAWNGLTPNLPSLGFEPRTSSIWEPTLQPTELLGPLHYCVTVSHHRDF